MFPTYKQLIYNILKKLDLHVYVRLPDWETLQSLLSTIHNIFMSYRTSDFRADTSWKIQWLEEIQQFKLILITHFMLVPYIT